MAEPPACIWVLAGTNGAGKSSIAGVLLRESGGEYYNPDEAARRIRQRHASWSQAEANAAAWTLGVKQLQDAIAQRRDYYFETTLGGTSITACLSGAMRAGLDVRIWYAGLASPELHLARVAARVQGGGHDIPESAIRHRFDQSRRNLIQLLPELAELKVYDNSREAAPALGERPLPKLVLHWRDASILGPKNLRATPDWAKPIVAQALRHQSL